MYNERGKTMYKVFNFLNALFLNVTYADGIYTGSDTDVSNIGFLNQIKKGLDAIYGMIKSVVPWVAVVMAGVAIFKLMTGDEKQIQAAKRQLLWIIIGFIAIYLVPDLINAVAGAFGV